MHTLTAASPEHYTTLINTQPRVLADFYKAHCPGCRMLDASLAKFATTPAARGITLLKVSLETVGEDFFRALKLRQTPTLALFQDGVELFRIPGFLSPAQIEAAVSEHHFGRPAP